MKSLVTRYLDYFQMCCISQRANVDSDMAPLGCILFRFVSDVLIIKDHRHRFTLRESNMIMMKIPRFQLCGKPYGFSDNI